MNSMHIALSTLIFWNVSIIMMNLGCDIILRCKTFGTYLMVFLLFLKVGKNNAVSKRALGKE